MSNSTTPKYIHGYQDDEQERLRYQAKVIEKPIYDFIDFSNNQKLLEIGSGVGAQTEILLNRFPHLQITGVEYEPKQIAKAQQNMKSLGYDVDKVQFIQQDAKQLQLDDHYDAAFICWVLEHISEPEKVLQSMKPYLHEGAKIVITEVFNASFYTYPHAAKVMEYWEIYNNYQRSIGGDPDVGAKLGHLLEIAGYKDIALRFGGFHLDSRTPEVRAAVLDYWTSLMKSGAPALLEEGLISSDMVSAISEEMENLKHQENSIFYYNFIQATAFI
ncbi:class I SAM-dependent methyltransferase [Belliella kenyensis]|uniref:Class I SAM-dependent methyltransferase n=1 Tax=Belliella kenyensis TaxID=1472724 RepID=A0ABV8ENG2_9BACT|nr:class I SAM-dependent methyltransferase [Belliella kenyensis]MCH7401621.1 class I SAM-dependent methyltransferase [Belliella kenyensis]MDN3603100.1 class I SAM-dependent methyltransferase [Belliella kenyensis]